MRRGRVTAIVTACALHVTVINSALGAGLQFNLATSQSPGGLSYAGGSTPLTGSGIDIVDITGNDTVSNNGTTVTCSNCMLDFTTGNYTSFSNETWNFLSGGTVSISGGIDFPGGTTDVIDGSTLLSGVFTSAQVHDHTQGELHLHIDGATFTDTKHSALTDFYGLPGGQYTGGMTITFQTEDGITPGTAFNSNIINSGSVINQPVPIPAAIWLFLSGILGLLGLAKCRKTA
jgi:hypothetical protein